MADDKKKDDPSADAGAPKSGAVKPPVLEGTARKSGPDGKPEAEKSAATMPPKAGGADANKPSPPNATFSGNDTRNRSRTGAGSDPKSAETAARPGSPWVAGLAGGVLGLACAYGLAYAGLWPTAPVAPPEPDQRIGRLAAEVPELQTRTDTVQDELSTLDQRVAALEQQEPPSASPAPAEVTGLSDQLEALSQRLAALEEQAQSAPSAQPAEAVTALEGELAAVKQQAQTLAQRLDQTDQSVTALDQKVASASQTSGAEVRLPLILSGLETAFDSGRPFDLELSALRQALPDIAVPKAVAAAAPEGLPRPESTVRQFEDALPTVLAGRPAAPDASWQDTAGNWFRGLIALRPSASGDGDGPEAGVSRIEEALARRDFITAHKELQSLPQPMQQAAGETAAQLETLAQAQQFLIDVRSTVLSAENPA